MKKIFSKVTKMQIIISLGYVLCMGLYTEAKPSQKSEKTNNVKTEATTENQKSPENEKASTEQNPAKKDNNQTEKTKQSMPTVKETDKSKENDSQAEKTKQPTSEKETVSTEKDKAQKDKSEAEQVKTPVPPIVNKTADTKTKEPKKEENLIEEIKQPELFVNKVIHYHKAKRNSFVTFYITPDFHFYYNKFSLMIQAGLGKVIDLPNLASPGFLEGEIGFNGLISEQEQTLNLQLKTEINFIRNNGINSFIPGIDIPISLNIDGLGKSFTKLYFNIGTGMYLKAFLSKDFALIPRFGIKLNLQTSGFGYLKRRNHIISLELGLGLRRYF